MEKLLENARTTMLEFIEQRDALMQQIKVNDGYAPILMQMLSDIDKENESDFFFIFPIDFVDQEQYSQAFVNQLEGDLDRYVQILEELEKPPIELPDTKALRGNQVTPVQRVRDGIRILRSLMPKTPGHLLVIALFPMELSDEQSFCEFLNDLNREGPLDPTFRACRVFVRVPDPAQLDWESRTRCGWINHDEYDFSQEAIEKATQEIVDDENEPLEKRVQALLSVAVYDYGFGRIEEAENKLKTVLAHYQETENIQMQASVMSILGDLYRYQVNDNEQAVFWYECATVPAIETNSPIVLLQPTRSLGEIAYERNQYKEAASWFEHAENLARHIPDAATTMDVMEKRGLAYEQLGEIESAASCWQGAITLAENLEFSSAIPHLQEHLRRVRA